MRWTGAPLETQASIQLCQAPSQAGDILRRRGLQLTFFFLVNMRDLTGLDGLEKADQPVSLFMPVFAHETLRRCFGSIMPDEEQNPLIFRASLPARY